MTETAYTGKDITVLEGLEPVRLRPGMYIGSTGSRGLHHLVYEVVDNAVDEALAGRNDFVEVRLHPDHSVTVVDHGAGIPVDLIEDQDLSALTVVLTKLHAGGKFGGDGYKVSGGLHGVGVSVVNALSEWLVAEVRRDGKVYRQEFARGNPVTGVDVTGTTDESDTGTTISFLPDARGLRGARLLAGHPPAAPPRDGLPDARAPHPVRRRPQRRVVGGVPLRGRHPRLRPPRELREGSRSIRRSPTSRQKTRRAAARSRSRSSGTRSTRPTPSSRSPTTSTRSRAARTAPASTPR